MSACQKKLASTAYRIAWICPVVHVERLPAVLMLDEEHQDPDYEYENEDYPYFFGEIKGHNVVIGSLPSGYTGNANVAHLTISMQRSFTKIRDVLLVGIGGGIPRANPQPDPSGDIHLGDVVVGWPGDGRPSFVNYSKGRYKVGEFEKVGQVKNPSRRLIGAYDMLVLRSKLGRETFRDHIDRLKKHTEFNHPGVLEDRLFEATYNHIGAYGDCSDCKDDQLVKRKPRKEGSERELIFHAGKIASGEFVVMDPELRDCIRDQEGAICVETEVYGASISTECLVIRGISDYADSHKTGDPWRHFAAGRAAVFARALICSMRSMPAPEIDQVQIREANGVKEATEACLKSLTFERRLAWVTEVRDHTKGTTEWLQRHRTYTSWLNREQDCEIPELLWLKGKPGSGKSTLMKSLMNSNPMLKTSKSSTCAAFFFDRKGSSKQKTSNGLYRSLLYQLMEADPTVCAAMLSKYDQKVLNLEPVEGASPHRVHWSTAELKSMLEDVFKAASTRPTIILIDSVDECGEEKDAKDVVKFCRDILRRAREGGVTLNICISSRSSFALGEGGHLLALDQLNAADIRTYVHDRIESHGVTAKKLATLIDEITTKSAGIFLWARLAMDLLLDDRDGGRNLEYSKNSLQGLSLEFEDIYKTMLVCPAAEPVEDRQERLRFFQWIIFANRPLKLREWYTIVGMIQEPPPLSLKEWTRSPRNPIDIAEDGASQTSRRPESIQNDREMGQDLLVKWIQRVSRGLVEVSDSPEIETADIDSDAAGPGSMLSNIGESRTVSVIHTSVHDFFHRSSTFGGLVPFDEMIQSVSAEQTEMNKITAEELHKKTFVADGHATVLQSCLNYLYLEELSDLAERRQGLASAAGDSVGNGIYRNDQVPFSFSAAASQRSSEEGSMDGRLPLAALRKDPGEILGLQGLLNGGQLQDTDRMKDWLSGSVRSCSPKSMTAEDILQQRLSVLSGEDDEKDEGADEMDQRSDIFERSSLHDRMSESGRVSLSNIVKDFQIEQPQFELLRDPALSPTRLLESYNIDMQDLLRKIELPPYKKIRQPWEKVLSEHSAASRNRTGASVKAAAGDIYSLLQYSSDEIFTHASSLELQTIRLDWLVDTLLKAWGRITTLREDVKKEANFLEFCIEAGTLDGLVIPVLEQSSCNSTAVDVFISAMAQSNYGITQDLVRRQMAAQTSFDDLMSKVKERNQENGHDITPVSMPPNFDFARWCTENLKYIRPEKQNEVNESMATLKDTAKYRWFLTKLLMPDEHQTRYATKPISRADAFDLWILCFDALQQKREEKMPVYNIRRMLETGEPESPLEIAFRVRDDTPSMYQAMVAMGAYSDKDIDDWIKSHVARGST